MSKNAYSELKAAWHLDSIKALRAGAQIVPTQVQLIISDLCNQDCDFCAYRMSNGFTSEQFIEVKSDGTVNRNPNRMIPVEKASEILKDLAGLGVKAIQFTGGGEPTVHPKHMELFELCLDLGMEAGLVTNGVILKKNWDSILPKFKWIRVSLDSGSPDNYSRIRRAPPETYNRVLRNISQIANQIEMAGSDCLLGVGFVISPENFYEIVPATKDAYNSGAKYIRLSAMFSRSYEKPFSHIYDRILEQIRNAKINYRTDVRAESWWNPAKTFEVVDLFGDRISDLSQNKPDYHFCGYQQFNVYIGANLKVYRCCSTAYTAHGEVGNLENQTFLEWFRTKEKHEKYKNFDAKTCDICQFNNKNRTINYMISNPLHINFV